MNLTSKDILAKLLATENVTVTHRNAQTASFNVRDRVLTLPMWDNMESCTYDHLVGHEVGHALYTPEAGWHEAVCSHGQAYKSFLNVVEDARIEKMIQARYPGLRRSFVSSYKKMLADGFFGGDIDLINTYDLIDRINTYFKVGRSAGVRIERSELPWIREIEALETWEEVVDVTDRLYAFCENVKKDEMDQLEELMSSPENQPEEQGQDEDEGYDDFEGEESEESEESESADTGVDNAEEFAPEDFEDGDSTDQSPLGDISEDAPEDGDLSSKTDKILRQNIASEHGDNSNVIFTNITLNTAPVSGLIVDHKHIINEIMFTDSTGCDEFVNANRYFQASENRKGLRHGKARYKKFLLENKKTVNYMVKEFEMKKSAAAYSRQTVSKTGVIDPVKMNSYLYNDDIFRKVSTTLDGKDHGMLMYVDWSGSMSNDLTATIEQLLNLVLFCRQVNIPYRVYAFTDRFHNHMYTDALSVQSASTHDTVYNQAFRLMELFTSNMNRKDFTTMSETLLAIGDAYSRGSYRLWNPPARLLLGGTPLDDCIIAAMQIHEEFKAKTRVDIVNTIFLTDGDSHHVSSKTESNDAYPTRVSTHFDFSGERRVMYFVDSITKKRYKVLGHNCNITSTLLKMYRDRTKSTTIGYRIMSPNWSQFRSQMPNVIRHSDGMELCKKMRVDRFTVLPPTLGYDKCFAIAGGRFLSTSNGAIEVEADASKGKIRTAFKKANSSRKGSRKMLSDLIETIS